MSSPIFSFIARRVVALEPQPQFRRSYPQNVTWVQKAVGAAKGRMTIMKCDAPNLSSFSEEWLRAVKASGRFGSYRWVLGPTVEVTTLDALIEQYGIPSFIKIDVEGFEYEVLAGLSHSVKALSFEWTPECLDATMRCVSRLVDLGDYEFAWDYREIMKMSMEGWVAGPQLMSDLHKFVNDSYAYGDVYARLKSGK